MPLRSVNSTIIAKPVTDPPIVSTSFAEALAVPPIACAMALKYNKGMIMIRKQGKLPGKTKKISYSIEYGKAVMEIQQHALKKGQRVVICDDLLATGGTAKASAKLVETIGGKVTGFAIIVELTDLNGIKKIHNYKCQSLVKY